MKSVEIDDDILAQIPGQQSALGRNRLRRDQNLTKRRTCDVVPNATGSIIERVDRLERPAVAVFQEQIRDKHWPSAAKLWAKHTAKQWWRLQPEILRFDSMSK